jgi:PPM family protein phosphatase
MGAMSAATPGGAMRARVAAQTDRGCVRPNNEDAFSVGDLDARALLDLADVVDLELGERGLLLVVCDGMGGTEGGEVASALAVEGLWTAMRDAAPTRDVAIYARHLRRAVRAANQLVFREGKERELPGMGTTLSAAGLAGTTLVIAQVGDSRVYVERGGALHQVTRDQSLVSALRSAGRITEEQAKRSLQRSTILQALGVRDDVEVSLSIAELRRGDRVLVCSDGLHGVVDDQAIARVLGAAAPGELGPALEALFAKARRAGAPDNVSAILAEFDGEGLAPPGADDDLAFVELDPFTEGEGALSETSRVARRLAARAGLRSDEQPVAEIVATRQHAVIPLESVAAPPRGRARQAPWGPATAALASRSRIGLATWLAAAIALTLVALALWRLP